MADDNVKEICDAQNVDADNVVAQDIEPELVSLDSDQDACSEASVSEASYDILSAARRTSEMLQELEQPEEQPYAPQIRAYQSLCKAIGDSSTNASNAINTNIDIGSYPRHAESASTSAPRLRKLPDVPTYSAARPGSAFGTKAPDVWWVVLKGVDPGIYISVDVAERASGGLADTRIIPSLSLREATSTYFSAKGKGKALFTGFF